VPCLDCLINPVKCGLESGFGSQRPFSYALLRDIAGELYAEDFLPREALLDPLQIKRDSHPVCENDALADQVLVGYLCGEELPGSPDREDVFHGLGRVASF